MLEVIGCVPKLATFLQNNIDWIRNLLNSTKETIREFASLLYGIIINEILSEKDFEQAVNYLVIQTNNKSLETQHGAIVAIANSMERKIMIKKLKSNDFSKWELFKKCTNTIGISCN